MRTLPPLSDSCRLEHRVAEILTEQEKKLEIIATEKDWEEEDKETNK